MRLSFSIPLVTGFVLVMTVIVNIVGLGVFINELFPVYLNSIAPSGTSGSNPDPNLLKAFIQANTLDASTRHDYETIITDLETFTQNLSDISKNPENYIGSGSNDQIQLTPGNRVPDKGNTILAGMKLIGELMTKMKNPVSSMSHEEKFIRDVLIRVLGLNLIWIILIFLSYFLWVRRLFRPIHIVTENLKGIIDTGKYTSIPYRKRDEFRPLTEMINTLHRSLSLQEKIRSDFLSDLSHEIRTPITTVRCYLEGLHDGVIEMNPETMQSLNAELVRLTDITKRIMDYERFSGASSEKIEVRSFAPLDPIRTVTDQYRPQLMKTGQVVEADIRLTETITMDYGMFLQILHNLISNFLKYAGNDTTLTISIIREKQNFTLIFRDNGKGVPETEIPYLLERFYRVDKARTGSDGSMGIGLSIVDKIARLHGGKCRVMNQKTGGFMVKITLAG